MHIEIAENVHTADYYADHVTYEQKDEITLYSASGVTDYHILASALQVKTSKNGSILKLLN